MSSPSLKPPSRLLSLDVLRGITIAFMILVNNNGGPGSWGFMNHAAWNGLTPTDLVFPTFLFVVGASIVFAFDARLRRGDTRPQLTRHTVQRATILFLLGVVVNTFPFIHTPYLRIYGVLQRIALCYLIVGLFYLWDRRVWTKVAALAVALVGYWALLRLVPVPGAGLPGNEIPFMDQTQNLTAWIDRQLMPHHLYLGWTDHNTRDPEGLLSTLPALGTALLGLLTGFWLRAAGSVQRKALGLALAAFACLASGYLWGVWFPLNKNMWTSSYVLVAAGWSLALFAVVYGAIELCGWRRGWTWPWVVFGSNAIVAYLFSELFPSLLWNLPFTVAGRRTDPLSWVFTHLFARIPDPGWAAFAFAVSFLGVCFLPVWGLYWRRIFVKV
jgi:predicted acyltransferase